MENIEYDLNAIPQRSKKSIENEEIEKNALSTMKKTKRIIYKNVFIIGLAWILVFTAYQSMANLQSSLNKIKGLGTISLSMVYVSLIIGSLLLPSTMIQKLGIKKTISICICAYILFIAANMYSQYYTLIPAAIILGRKSLFLELFFISNLIASYY